MSTLNVKGQQNQCGHISCHCNLVSLLKNVNHIFIFYNKALRCFCFVVGDCNYFYISKKTHNIKKNIYIYIVVTVQFKSKNSVLNSLFTTWGDSTVR